MRETGVWEMTGKREVQRREGGREGDRGVGNDKKSGRFRGERETGQEGGPGEGADSDASRPLLT